jgi:hypothetical protein
MMALVEPCPYAHPELLPRLVFERRSEALGRSARSRDRACRDCAAPRERAGTPLSLIGEAHFFKREFDDAAAKLLLSIQENPGYPHSYRVLAAC